MRDMYVVDALRTPFGEYGGPALIDDAVIGDVVIGDVVIGDTVIGDVVVGDTNGAGAP